MVFGKQDSPRERGIETNILEESPHPDRKVEGASLENDDDGGLE
jgi:hypothetical protein